MSDEDEEDSIDLNKVDQFLLFPWDGSPSRPEILHLYTICVLAVRCNRHDKMAVCHVQSNGKYWWLPYIMVRECYKWTEMGLLIAELFAQELKVPFDRSKVFDLRNDKNSDNNNNNDIPFERLQPHIVSRIQLTNGEFITRIFYIARWRLRDKNCCRTTKNICWISLKQLQQIYSLQNQNQNNNSNQNGSILTSQQATTGSSTNLNQQQQQQQQSQTNFGQINNNNNNNNNNDDVNNSLDLALCNRKQTEDIMNNLWGSEVITYATLLLNGKLPLATGGGGTGGGTGGGGGGGTGGSSGSSSSSSSSSPTIALPATIQLLHEQTGQSDAFKYVDISSPPPQQQQNVPPGTTGSPQQIGLASPGSPLLQQSPAILALGGANDPTASSASAGTAPGNNNNSSIKNIFKNFIKQSSYGENEVAKIYNDFVQHCYPSNDMSFVSFEQFFFKCGLNKIISLQSFPLKNIFKAMNYKLKGFLGFNEFLLGLISLDPQSPSNDVARFNFLFRFYDSNSDGLLDQNDIEKINADIKKFNSKQVILESPTNDNNNSNNNNKFSMNYNTFVSETSNFALKNLCRCTKSIIQILINSNQFEMIGYNNRPFYRKIPATCIKCRPKNYTIAIHSLRLDFLECRLKDPQILLGTNSVGQEQILGFGYGHVGCSELTLKQYQQTRQPQQRSPFILNPQLNPNLKYVDFLQKHSLDFIFNPTTNANYVIDLIRKLAGNVKMTEQQKKEIGQQVINGLSLNVMKMLCEEVSEIYSTELRVVKVSTPTYVMGDIHGNLNDLLIFESQLWPLAPSTLSTNVLFLGDYVDRGEFSIEVVCYLFAMKILAPNKFFMLRGNHEVRTVQRSFTFEKECMEKYGRHGGNVFEMFNKVFDILPFAAVIDESIYCAHGGIPFTQTKIEDLIRLPLVIQEPEQEAPSVWEILWSDPINQVEFTELSNFMHKNEETGYLSNMKRSTAFYFGEKASQAFLKQNNLTHVIRAHEVIPEGFKFNHKGTVITIFSCSRYMEVPNRAAAIMIEAYDRKGYIKIITLDT